MISVIVSIVSIIPIIIILYLDNKLEKDIRRFSEKMRKEAELERLENKKKHN